jgi:hypothetical protein
MKHVSIILLIVMVSMASCAKMQQKEMTKESGTYTFQPKPLDDEWSKWLVGKWQATGGQPNEEGSAGVTIELGLNGQFLIMKTWAETEGMTDEEKKQMKKALKETINISDEDWERFLSMPYKSLVIQTIDPKTGERIGYLFDSLRCIAKGTGRLEGNKEIMEWEWSRTSQGATSIGIIEKNNDNKFTGYHKYTLPNGNKIEEKAEFTRKKIKAEE